MQFVTAQIFDNHFLFFSIGDHCPSIPAHTWIKKSNGKRPLLLHVNEGHIGLLGRSNRVQNWGCDSRSPSPRFDYWMSCFSISV